MNVRINIFYVVRCDNTAMMMPVIAPLEYSTSQTNSAPSMSVRVRTYR